MRYSFWFLASFMFVSCGGNDSKSTTEDIEKVKQAKLDSIAELRLSEINWEDVDTFPIFVGTCSDTVAKEEQKKCFEDALVKLLYTKLQKEKYQATKPIEGKIMANIKVDNSGKITLVNLEAPENTMEYFAATKQSFEDILVTHLDEISKEIPINPATKQGLEVSTQFSIPIEVNVK